MKHLHTKTRTESKPLGDAVTRAITQVTKALADVPGTVQLSAADRKRVTKMRTGGERYVEQMAALLQAKAVTVGGVDGAVTLQRLDQASALEPLLAELRTATKTIADTITFLQGQAWHDALDVYAVARRDVALAEKVAPIAHFLALGPHHEGAVATPKPTPATSAA